MIKLIEILKGITRNPFTGEVYEGLIKTIDINTATNILNNHFKSLPGFNIYNDGKTITLGFNPRYINPKLSKFFYGNTYDTNIGEVLKYANNLGYLPSYFTYNSYGIESQKWNASKFRKIIYEIEPEYMSFRFEKKYDDVVSPPNFIYHITNENFIKSIKSIGLKPKTLNKKSTHPERIYFSLSKEKSDNLWKNIKMNYAKGKGILLTIDTSDLTNVFYEDPNSKDSIYTYDNIPKENIVNIESIKEQ